MRLRILRQRRRNQFIRNVGKIAILAVLAYYALTGMGYAGVVTPCSPDLTPPTPTGTETEQERQTIKWRRNEVMRQEVCEQLPVLKVLPYAVETRHGEFTFRFYFFLKR